MWITAHNNKLVNLANVDQIYMDEFENVELPWRVMAVFGDNAESTISKHPDKESAEGALQRIRNALKAKEWLIDY